MIANGEQSICERQTSERRGKTLNIQFILHPIQSPCRHSSAFSSLDPKTHLLLHELCKRGREKIKGEEGAQKPLVPSRTSFVSAESHKIRPNRRFPLQQRHITRKRSTLAPFALFFSSHQMINCVSVIYKLARLLARFSMSIHSHPLP